MSSRLADLFEKPPASSQRLPLTALGRCANSVTTPDDDLYVTIGSFDGHRQRWGPCQWAPAEALPTRGDDVLVVFDEDQVPWVIAFTWGNRTASGNVAAPAPVVATDPLYANVDAVRIGPMPWSPHFVIPQLGDTLLVMFDEDGNPWGMVTTVPPPASPPPPIPRLIAHQRFTADFPFTAVTDGTAQTIVQTPSVAYSGDPVYITFYSPRLEANASALQGYYIALFRDAVYLASKWFARGCSTAFPFLEVMVGLRDTPPAGTHVYSARAWSDSGNGGTFRAGLGGQNNLAPGFLRVVLDT